MVKQNDKGEPLVLPTMNPSKSFLNHYGGQLSKTTEFFSNLKKNYEPPENMKPASRYEAAPAWKNTFLNIQPNSNTALFMSEGERFDRSHFAKTGFQIEQKEKKILAQQARFDRIRRNQDEFNNRLQEKMVEADQKERQKTFSKHLSQTLYSNREALNSSAL